MWVVGELLSVWGYVVLFQVPRVLFDNGKLGKIIHLPSHSQLGIFYKTTILPHLETSDSLTYSTLTHLV